MGGRTSSDSRRAIAMMMAFAAYSVLMESVLGVRLQRRYDVTQIVWCRYAVHLLIISGLCGWHQPTRLWRTSRPFVHISRSLLMLLMPIGFGLALEAGMPVNSLWTIMWIAPVMILAFAHVLLGEHPTRAATAASVAGFPAACLILKPVAVVPPMALLWSLLMAGSFALYIVATRLLRHEDLRTNLFYTAAGVFTVLSAYVPRVWIAPTAHDVVIFVAIGGTGLLALLALDRAIERAEVSMTASFVHIQVVLTVLVEWSRRPAIPSLRVLIGGLVIVGFAIWQWRALDDPKVLTAPPDSARMPA